MAITYKDAGVDVEKGYEAVALMKKHIAKTMTDGVIGSVGGFGGMFSLKKAKDMDEPVLVAGTDGVGTKLRLAFEMDIHDTVGQDCVAMCVNDVVCQGAEPLLFLDYIATGNLDPQKAADIVKGITDGCVLSGCALVGGETAEMPGFYGEGEYDMAGFTVGLVDRAKAIDGSEICAGDVLIGFESTGVHSNGFSLVRKLLETQSIDLNQTFDGLEQSIGKTLLTPTRIYVKELLDLIKQYNVHGLAHITGGGFIENIPRMLPEGLQVKIDAKNGWTIPPVFGLLQTWANISDEQMFNTFNMGIGMVAAVPLEDVVGIFEYMEKADYNAHIIGKVVKGTKGVEFV
jgi:phosphoribosylformylglycinamidine cyclo-ligase